MNPQTPNQQPPTNPNPLPPPPGGVTMDSILSGGATPRPPSPSPDTFTPPPQASPPADTYIPQPVTTPPPSNGSPVYGAPLQNHYQPPPPSAQAPVPPAAASAIQPKVNPNSTQNTLQVAEIRDGIVIMNDGSFRSVVMLKSINFDLMSQQEREAV
jgi:hypothetical protein